MDWLVKNAQSRDVERQHLNKILQEIRATLNELEARMARDSTEEARIRTIVAQMLTGGTKSGISVTYNTTSKAIDFAVNTFTIQLTGAVTGIATVTGLSNVSITTTLTEDIDGVEEAPLDGLSYWRNMGTWVTVPFPLETLQFLTPGGILVLDEELNWYARTIEGVTGEIDVTDGDGIAGNPTLGLADVPDSGTGDSPVKLYSFDSKGRKTGSEDASTDDLPEGSTNLYHTPTRVYEKVKDVLVAGTGITLTEDDLTEEIVIDASVGVVLDYLADPATNSNADLYDTIVDLLADMQAKGLMAGPPPAPPVNTVAPAVTGGTTTGDVLSCSTGTWTGSPTSYAYQWQEDIASVWTDLSGEVANTYTTDHDGTFRCEVIATNGDGDSAPAYSNSVAVSTGGGSGTFGYTGTIDDDAPAGDDRIWAVKAVLTETANLTMFHVNKRTGAGGPELKGLIFSDNAGEPDVLVASTATVTCPSGPTIVDIPITGTLPPGTYWLAAVTGGVYTALGATSSAPGEIKRAEGYPYPGWNTNWPGTAGTVNPRNMGIYVDYTT